MKKKAKQRPARAPRTAREEVATLPAPSRRPLMVLSVALTLSVVAAAVLITRKRSGAVPPGSPSVYVPRPPGTLTFTKDVASIVFTKCSFCHRPGQAAPFSLLTYREVKAKEKGIQEVIASGFMPPWLPEPGYGHFAGDLSLGPEQRGMVQQWLAEGAPEGSSGDLPELPPWPADWQLGPPDLIVSLPAAYTLPAEGKDIYRNFVVPIPLLENRFVRAVEFRPGNSRVVHHAFVEFDSFRQSRFLTGTSQPPGFDGMDLPPSVHMPMGQMLGWQPGKPAMESPEGLSWLLEKRSDLVLQLHLHPSGKPETVQPSVGFYFTDRAPTNTPFLLKLARYTIDIPPGEKDYRIHNSYVLPVDVDLMRINPHTHYLGRRIEGWAILPDGSRKELLLIRNWDFNWQGDYKYREPVALPKATTLHMQITFDNSTGNINNPNQPPQRVRYGLQTTDEMGELWFQVLARDRNDLAILSRDFFLKATRDSVESLLLKLQNDPQDAVAHAKLGSALFALGQVEQAVEHLRTATHLDPANPLARGQLGSIYLRQNLLPQAQAEFEAVVRVNPQDNEAQGSLGYICMQQRRYAEAEIYFGKALAINPEDTVAQANLKAIREARRGRQ